jgi:hypothetical protein
MNQIKMENVNVNVSYKLKSNFMKKVNGITIEKFAALFVKTADIEDEINLKKMLQQDGISLEEWKRAKKIWSDKMNDPLDNGDTANLFMHYYEAALEMKYLEKEPCSLEEFTRIHCELTYSKGYENDIGQCTYEEILRINGVTYEKWGIYKSFWLPRIAMYKYRNKFEELVRKYSKKMFGKAS